MTVFKTFLKVLNKCKMPIILYTVILIGFGGFNMATSDNSINFVANKPDVLIINKDENIGITKNLINYIKDNTNIIKIKEDEESINDALFYRDVNYIIYIPKNYRQDVLNKKNPEIKVKSTKDYQASLAEMLLKRYLKIENIYVNEIDDEEEIIDKINSTLKEKSKIEMTSKLDTNGLSKAATYYNFASYSILAGAIYVICLILSSFNEQKIKKRIITSSMNYKKHNHILLLANSLFALVLWIFYILLSFILIGDVMFSIQGLIYMLNSFIFTMCALSIAFLLANTINNKNTINGIVNVIALGSSFLCGAFVPIEWLPDFVLKVAHILPSYWYIKTNELLSDIEVININSLQPIIFNMIMLLVFIIIFIILANIVTKRKQKIG